MLYGVESFVIFSELDLTLGFPFHMRSDRRLPYSQFLTKTEIFMILSIVKISNIYV